MKISVIMLTYNRENFIERAIQSILSQIFENFELILVDNGSTDRSGEICDQYAEKDSRVKVVHRERGNIGSGRNAGLDLATGKYITFVDDDDWCDLDFLEFLHNLATEYCADVSICGAWKEEHGQVTSVGVSDDILVMDAEESIVTLLWRTRYNTGFPTKLISGNLFDHIRFEETGQYDDISLMYKILADAKSVVSYGRPKYHVYRHEGNNSSATAKDHLITPAYLEFYRTAYRNRTKWLCTRFPQRSEDWWYFDWSFQLSMVHKIVENHLIDCEKQLKEMRRELLDHRDIFSNHPFLQDFEKKRMEWITKSMNCF